MKAFFVLLLWLLLGFFFWSMKTKQCCTPSAAVTQQSTEVKADKATAGTIAGDVISAKNQAKDSLTQNDQSTALSESSSSEVHSSKTKSKTTKTRAQTTYDHSAFHTIKEIDGVFRIPLKKENTINDEIQAQIEQTCLRIANSVKKVVLTAVDNGDMLACKVMTQMKERLIRCGVSPHRILTINKTNKDVDSYINLQEID